METYEVLFKENETEGVYAISLVDSPAMESQFIALSEQKEIQLKAIDEEKRILLGAVLIPNKPIYRKQGGKEFNITFPEKTIQLTMENFFKKGYQNNSTLEHNEELKLQDVTFVESWIKESEIDKSVHYGFNEPNGTWFASMKVNNDEVWNDFVKTGKVKGFSIDGFFDLEKINLKSNNSDLDFRNKMVAHHKMAIDMVNEYKGLLKDKTLLKIASDIIETQTVEINTMQKLNLKSEYNMNVTEIVSAIKEGFASLSLKKEEEVKVTLGSVNTADGTVKINFEGDTVATGLAVTMTAPDGTELPLPDGEYNLEGGMSITVSNGTVEEVATAKEETTDTAEEPTPQTPMSNDAPQVKSEKVTQEVFYQLSKEDWNTLGTTIGNLIDAKFTELETKLSTQKEEVVALTKTKPAKEVSHPNPALAKFRASKL